MTYPTVAAGVQYQSAVLRLSAEVMTSGRWRGTIDLDSLAVTFKEIHEVLLEPVEGLALSRDYQDAQPAARAQIVDGEENERADFDVIRRLHLVLENTSGDELSFEDKILTLRGIPARPVPHDYTRPTPSTITNDTSIFTLTDAEGAAVAASWEELPSASGGGGGEISNGSVTDAKIGNRTADDTATDTSNTGTLTQLLSRLAYRIKRVVFSGSGSLTVPSGGGTVVLDGDTRLTNARTPSAHKSSHATGGTDAITPSDIGAAASSHTHDDRYYTESETDTLLGGKAASSHTHSGSDISSGTVAAARLGVMTGASSSVAGASGAVPQPASGDDTKFLCGNGTWATPAEGGGSAGEANTASNAGSGAGVYKTKSGVDLVLRSLVALSNKISIAVAGNTNEINFDISESNLTHNNLSGLTTGDPHTQYITKATATTKGDILAASASATLARLGVGSKNQILVPDSGQTTGLKWANQVQVVALTDGTTISTDASLGDHFRVTLGGNRTLANPTNAYDGQKLTFELIQDATGSRTLALGNKFVLGSDITATTLTTTASKRDFLGCIYNSTADKFYVVSFVKGF